VVFHDRCSADRVSFFGVWLRTATRGRPPSSYLDTNRQQIGECFPGQDWRRLALRGFKSAQAERARLIHGARAVYERTEEGSEEAWLSSATPPSPVIIAAVNLTSVALLNASAL
jgi:hypothetical protein